MDAGSNLTALPCQMWANICEFRVAQNLARDGFAAQPVHHIALADAVAFHKHVAHAWRLHTRGA